MTSEGDTRPRASGPIQSMTGSGSASGATGLGAVTVECRSTNGRGLTIKMRVSGECQGIEPALETYLRSRLQRGSVFVNLALTEPAATGAAVIDVEAATAAASQLEELAQRIGKTVTLSDVLAVPGVIAAQTRSARVSREIPADIRGLLAASVDELVADREREGAATAAAMLDDVARIESELAEVTKQAPQIVQQYREKLIARVNEFLEGRAKPMDDGDVIREVSLFADRVDVAEELQRLGSHLAKARDLLQAEGAIGRNLEFLVQEMLREVNTLGSKTPDVAIAHRVVEMKSCIDKLKEQAANLA